jgi:hypothetical protein
MEWACCEAHRHVWLESQFAHQDVRMEASRDWKLNKWPEFLGHRRHEHLLGSRNWAEFPAELHGVARGIAPSPLLDLILARVKWGAENLDMLEPGSWPRLERFLRGFLDLRTQRPSRPNEVVVHILDVLRINDMRPEFPDAPVEPPSGCYCRAG